MGQSVGLVGLQCCQAGVWLRASHDVVGDRQAFTPNFGPNGAATAGIPEKIIGAAQRLQRSLVI